MTKPLLVLLALCITIGSFIDEASLVATALAVNHSNKNYLALLYTANMLGAMTGSRLCAYLLTHLSEQLIVKWLFFVQAVMVLAIYYSQGIGIALMGFGLGAVGSVLWTAILSVVPLYCPKDYLDTANKALQTISNLGAVAGPALVGLIYHTCGATVLIYLALASMLAGIGVLFYQHTKPSPTQLLNQAPSTHHSTNNSINSPPTSQSTSSQHNLTALFGEPSIKKALMPLSVIIVLTSMLNVLLVPYVNTVLGLGAKIYGTTLTMMSLGLLVSPFLVSGLFATLGRVRGAMLGASVMGMAMILFGVQDFGVQNIAVILVSALLVGVGNGIINTLMGAFMMHTLGNKSKQLMPYYVLCLQSCVLMGFGLAIFVDKARIGTVLIMAGGLVVMVGLMGAVVNQPISKTHNRHG